MKSRVWTKLHEDRRAFIGGSESEQVFGRELAIGVASTMPSPAGILVLDDDGPFASPFNPVTNRVTRDSGTNNWYSLRFRN